MRLIKVNNEIIAEKGKKLIKHINLPDLYSSTATKMPVYTVTGNKPGPVLLVMAAVHGDEINGIEIIKRIYNLLKPSKINGTLIAIPVVNIYGLVTLSRYLPDRRDLNRSFPGTESGSLASRIAYLLKNQIFSKADAIIDLHTGAIHRTNLPQVRISSKSIKSLRLAKAFRAPVILKSNIRDGSIRYVGDDLDIPVLVYEGGEALRFDEVAIKYGLKGVLNVMKKMKMREKTSLQKESSDEKSKIVSNSMWLRAPLSGIVNSKHKLGQKINKNEIIANIFDPFTNKTEKVRSNISGIIIGKNNLPLVNEGDALFNIAYSCKSKESNLDDNIQMIFTDKYFFN